MRMFCTHPTCIFRAAQRAFRERKQSQLAELQARIKQFEQGEIERNIVLQNIAKRLKEENEQLRKENGHLKERVSLCLKEHFTNSGTESQRKRRREESFDLCTQSSDPSDHSAKRTRAAGPTTASPFAISYPSSASMASPPEFGDFPDNGFSSASLECSSDLAVASTDAFNTTETKGNPDNRFPADSCGLCSQGTKCFCRDMVMRAVASDTPLSVGVPLRMEHFEHRSPATHLHTRAAVAETLPPYSILDKLPPFQPAVPLRRRAATSTKSIFELSTTAQSSTTAPALAPSPTCSGDPANCMACADDSFGQAFCAAVGESAATTPHCDDCPCRDVVASGLTLSDHALRDGPSTSDTIPTNDAWRQLKSHPNVAFTDLSLLADVVARRSKCTGPCVVISPALGTATPERMDSPPAHEPSAAGLYPQSMPHGRRRDVREQVSGSPPRLVPQEVLIECGKRRIREVRADAVKEALHMLDARNRFA